MGLWKKILNLNKTNPLRKKAEKHLFNENVNKNVSENVDEKEDKITEEFYHYSGNSKNLKSRKIKILSKKEKTSKVEDEFGNTAIVSNSSIYKNS